jgi:hypothetical protein
MENRENPKLIDVQKVGEALTASSDVTLRDLFALVAMHSLLSSRHTIGEHVLALSSYAVADTMLKERAK